MLSLVTLPSKTLHEPSIKLTKELLASKEIQQFIADMTPAMYEYEGIGLAAPQVGKNVCVCIIGKDAVPGKKKDMMLINPKYTKLSKKKVTDTEGCLSVPGKFGKISRYKDILVTALDENENKLEFEAHNFFARVIQHEIDHLNGILYIDKAHDIREVEKHDNRTTEQ